LHELGRLLNNRIQLLVVDGYEVLEEAACNDEEGLYCFGQPKVLMLPKPVEGWCQPYSAK